MKKIKFLIYLFIFIITILLIPVCTTPNGSSGEGGGGGDDDTISYTNISSSNTYNNTGDEVFFINTTGYVNLEYTLNGLTDQDVYFIFTNTNTSSDASNPTVTSNIINPIVNNKYNKNNSSKLTSDPVALRGKPEITEFNNYFYKNIKDKKESSSFYKSESFVPSPPLKDTIGDVETFIYDTNVSATITATCRSVVTVGSIILNIYVANDCWEIGGTKTYNVTQTMVDELADKFLQSGDDNDIYDWGTDIFGDQWGAHSEPTILIPESDTEITILLYDIDNDDVPSGGFTAGMFWSKDNLLNSYLTSLNYGAFSNERVMFYIDSVIFACDANRDFSGGGSGWDITDYWPSEMISTLAHEFQHMIHFYQKAVLQTGGYNSETWINEMCSLVAEDLLAYNIQLGDGPRGVLYSLGTEGSAGNDEGRLPWYNYFNDESVNIWYNSSVNYGVAYGFGSYLARNYGGVTLFRNIVQSPYTNYTAVQNAAGVSFATILRNWGVSNLLSDRTTPIGTYYRYNFDGFYTTLGYNLGSINLFNYDPSVKIYSNSPVGSGFYSSLNRASNRYFLAGSNLTGDQVWTVKLDNNVQLTVLVKVP